MSGTSNRSTAKQQKNLKRKLTVTAKTGSSLTTSPIAPSVTKPTTNSAKGDYRNHGTAPNLIHKRLKSLSCLFRQHAELMTFQSDVLDGICGTSTIPAPSLTIPPLHPLGHDLYPSPTVVTTIIGDDEQSKGIMGNILENVEKEVHDKNDGCHDVKEAKEELESHLCDGKETGNNGFHASINDKEEDESTFSGSVMSLKEREKRSRHKEQKRGEEMVEEQDQKSEEQLNNEDLKNMIHGLFFKVKDKSQVTVKQFRLLLEETYSIKLDKLKKKNMKDYLILLMNEDQDS